MVNLIFFSFLNKVFGDFSYCSIRKTNSKLNLCFIPVCCIRIPTLLVYILGSFPDPHTNFSCFNFCKDASLANQSISPCHSYNCLTVKDYPRLYCSEVKRKENSDSKSLTIFQRFKRAYKQHGKVLVGVHVATSTVWFGCFYYLAQR